jgi:hypothetical protein
MLEGRRGVDSHSPLETGPRGAEEERELQIKAAYIRYQATPNAKQFPNSKRNAHAFFNWILPVPGHLFWGGVSSYFSQQPACRIYKSKRKSFV